MPRRPCWKAPAKKRILYQKEARISPKNDTKRNGPPPRGRAADKDQEGKAAPMHLSQWGAERRSDETSHISYSNTHTHTHTHSLSLSLSLHVLFFLRPRSTACLVAPTFAPFPLLVRSSCSGGPPREFILWKVAHQSTGLALPYLRGRQRGGGWRTVIWLYSRLRPWLSGFLPPRHRPSCLSSWRVGSDTA